MAEQEVDLTEAQERAVKALAGLRGAGTLTALADALEARPNVVARTLGALERKEVVRRTDGEGWELVSGNGDTPADDPERLELRYVPLKTVTRWEENPKLHGLAGIRNSIRQYGFGDPVKHDSALGALVYGNGRVEALESLKRRGDPVPRGISVTEDGDDWLVPVLFGLDQAGREMAERFAVDHNATTLGPGFDRQDLDRLWDGAAIERLVSDWGAQIEGFELPEVRAMAASDLLSAGEDIQGEDSEADPAESAAAALTFARECQERWQVRHGQSYRFAVAGAVVGCGDNQSQDTVDRALRDCGIEREGGILMVADPPYCSGGFQESGRAAGTWGDIASDGLSSDGYRELIRSAIAAARPTSLYMFTDWRMWCSLVRSVESQGLANRAMIVWDKMTPGLGGIWRTQHELILYASRSGSGRQKGTPSRSNVIALRRSGNRMHYTEKPVELMAELIGNDASGGRPTMPVIDTFCGAGSTLLAAIQEGRRAIGIDIEPLCVAATIQRIADATGEEPELLGA